MDANVKKLMAEPRRAAWRRPSEEEARAAVRTLIAWAGDDPDREGVHDTPERVVNALGELSCGYGQDPPKSSRRLSRRSAAIRTWCWSAESPLFSLRAPHGAVHGPGAHRLYPSTECRPLEAARTGRHLCRRLQTQETMTADLRRAAGILARAASP